MAAALGTSYEALGACYAFLNSFGSKSSSLSSAKCCFYLREEALEILALIFNRNKLSLN
jgi:hypothetical protein